MKQSSHKAQARQGNSENGTNYLVQTAVEADRNRRDEQKSKRSNKSPSFKLKHAVPRTEKSIQNGMETAPSPCLTTLNFLKYAGNSCAALNCRIR